MVPTRTIADLSRLLVGESGGANKNDRLALVVGKLFKGRLLKSAKSSLPCWLGWTRQALRHDAFGILDLASALAHL